MSELGEAIHAQIKADFERRCASDSYITAIQQKIKNGTADMNDMSVYARRLGSLLRQSIEHNVRKNQFTDGKIFYGTAQSILEPLLKSNYELINSTCDEVQKAIDKKKGIGLQPQHAEFPDERARAAYGGVSAAESFEQAVRVMGATAENITGSFQTDFVKTNADFRSQAGLNTYIERSGGFKCCAWCADLSGKYQYPDNVPKDVFRRHDNCSCDVSYVSNKGRQNVHTKRYKSDTWGREQNLEYLRQRDAEKKAEREKRLALGKSVDNIRFSSKATNSRFERIKNLFKPMKLTPAQAQEKEAELLQKNTLTSSTESGIINPSKAYIRTIEFIKALGIESVPTHPFDSIPTEDEIISRLSGGDLTKGSCVSLAFAYAGNKGGFDVLDFRGGASCDFFADILNIADIARFNGVKANTSTNINDYDAVNELLNKVELGKEYILSTGKHTAVIRKTSGVLEYLEMQDSKNNGFKPFTKDTLKKRFECKKKYKVNRQTTPARNILIDRESLSTSDEFKDILKYLNTDGMQQMKGVSGYAK